MSDPIFRMLLTQTCTIERRIKGAADIYGAKAETLTVVSTGEACLIQTSYDIVEFDERGKKEVANLMGYFEIDSIIEVDDIVTVNSKLFAVVGVDDAGGQGHHLECPLRNLENKDN